MPLLTTDKPIKRDTDHVLFFIHIPKTAGSTLQTAIGPNYPRENIYCFSANTKKRKKIEELRDMGVKGRSKYAYYFGHCPYGLDVIMPEKNVTYLTLLRDPVERVVSTYYHITGHDTHPLYPTIKDMSLEDFALTKEWPQFYNTQTRMLSAELGDFSAKAYNAFSTKLADESDYWRARERLEKHMLVGVQDHFVSSVQMFAAKMGWKNMKYTDHRVNAERPKSDSLPPETVRKIRECHRFDVMLYDVAYRVFVRQCIEAGVSIQ